MAPIIGPQHWPFLHGGGRSEIIDAGADSISQLLAPFAIRDQPAFAALRKEAAFDKHGRNFRQTQNGKARTFDSAIKLAQLPDKRMIDAAGELDASGIFACAVLDIDRSEREVVLVCGGRAARGEGINFETSGGGIVIGSVEVQA